VPEAPAQENVEFDPLEVISAERTGPRRLTDLPRLLLNSLRLALRADRPGLLVIAGLQLGSSLLLGVQVLLSKTVLDAVLANNAAKHSLLSATPALLGLAAVTAVTTSSTVYVTQRQRVLSEKVRRHVFGLVHAVTVSVDLEEFERPRFYDRLQRVQLNALLKPATVTQSVIALVSGLAGVLTLLASLIVLQPLLVPLLALGGIPALIANRKAGRLEFRFAIGQTPLLRQRDYVNEVLTGRPQAKEVRAFTLGRHLADRYARLYDTYVDNLVRHIRRRTALTLIGTLGAAVLTAGTFVILLVLVSRGDISLADAGASLIAIRLLGTRVEALFRGSSGLYESSLFLADLNTFLQMEQPPAPEPAEDPGPLRTLECQGLSFRYPGTTVDAVRRVDLRIESGQIVALVGENGSGKTTLAKLLAQLYTPTAGKILWNGTDASSIGSHALRDRVAVIFQDFVRYALPARDNIGLGRVDRLDDLAAVRRAAKRARADTFLAALPGAYDTILSREFRDGRELSLGQWQRVAIARAFFRDAPFVVLDEPSAALDPRAEYELFRTMRQLLGKRTVLLISHRFSSVRFADVIFVMHRGKIVEHGTHDELMAAAGRYAEMFSLQAAAYL
jgi:ATP-binding cassette subfamily B protein